MKLYKRILLTIPLVAVTIVYCKFNDPDDKCSGIAKGLTNFIFYVSLLTTVIFAIIGTMRKRSKDEFRFEPITLVIIILTISALIFNTADYGHTTGKQWLYAESINTDLAWEKQNIILRKNGHFSVTLSATDFSCAVSGNYEQRGDTIIFDKATIDKTARQMTTNYLLTPQKLIPLVDTLCKNSFRVVATK